VGAGANAWEDRGAAEEGATQQTTTPRQWPRGRCATARGERLGGRWIATQCQPPASPAASVAARGAVGRRTDRRTERPSRRPDGQAGLLPHGSGHCPTKSQKLEAPGHPRGGPSRRRLANDSTDGGPTPDGHPISGLPQLRSVEWTADEAPPLVQTALYASTHCASARGRRTEACSGDAGVAVVTVPLTITPSGQRGMRHPTAGPSPYDSNEVQLESRKTWLDQSNT